MKKYGMLVFTLIIIVTTIYIYFYENSDIPVISCNCPEINFHSAKYGDIKNIIWSNQDEDHIIFLGVDTDKIADKEMSTLYAMNINTGEVKIMLHFPTHDRLKSFMQYFLRNYSCLYTASSNGVNETRIEEDYKIINDFYFIENFDKADSLCVGSKIYFTRPDDKLIYVKDFTYRGFSFSFNARQEAQSTYFKRADKLLLRAHGEDLHYTKKEENGINIYKLLEGNYKIKDELVARNIAYAKSDDDGRQIMGLYDNETDYGVFWAFNQSNGISFTDDLVDRISKNTDMFGQMPDVDADWETIAYTRYNDDHTGDILIGKKHGTKTQVVKNVPIVGPIRISRRGKKILFFTYEDEYMHVKVYDMDKKEIKDITGNFK